MNDAQLVAEARTLMEQGAHVALAALFAAHPDWPQTVPGYLVLGRGRRILGEGVAAEAAYRAGLQIDPAHVQTRLQLVELLLDLGRTAEAVAELHEGQARAPQAAGFAHRLLTLRFAEDPQAGHLDEIADLVAQFPNFIPARRFLINACLRCGALDRAQAALQAFAEGFPDNPHLAASQTAVAVAMQAAADETGPHRGLPRQLPQAQPALIQLAQSCKAAGDLDGVQRILDALRELPDTPQRAVGVARVAGLLGDHAAAIASFQSALDRNPLLHGARDMLARNLSVQGRLDEALATIDAGLDLAPGAWALGHRRLALLVQMRPNALDADDFEPLIAAAPHNPLGHRLYISWLRQTHQGSLANRAAERFATACPEHCDLQAELAETAQGEGDFRRVLELCQAADGAPPRSLVEIGRQAWALNGLERQDEITALRDEVALSHDTVAGQMLAARMALMQNDAQAAMAAYRVVLDRAPENPGALSALVRLLATHGQSDAAQAVVAAAPASVWAQPVVRRAAAYAEAARGEYVTALRILEEDSEFHRDPDAMAQCAWAWGMLGQIQDGLRKLEGAEPQAAKDKGAWLLAQAHLHRAAFNAPEIIRLCREALSWNPALRSCYTLLVSALILRGECDAAQEVLETASRQGLRGGATPQARRLGIVGHLLQEIRVDRTVVDGLRAAWQAADPLAEMRDLVQVAGDNTGSGVGLLMALRAVGRIGGIPP